MVVGLGAANHLHGAGRALGQASLTPLLACHPADDHCKRKGKWRRQIGRLGRSYVTKAKDLRDSATCFALRGRRGSGVRRSEGEKA